MKSLWKDADALAFVDDALALRCYTSRLLGAEPSLVLHGGGNTSVKIDTKDFYGEPVRVLYVKGSGWDLATIEPAGFAPVRLDCLLKLAERESLSDSEMVRQQRAALLDPYAPNPSIEAILHGIIPFDYVDHSHADAVVAVSNTEGGEQRLRDILGANVLFIPYVMPGFELAREIYLRTKECDWAALEAIVLMHHGVFTFADSAREAYERMINVVSKVEDFLAGQGVTPLASAGQGNVDALELARLRKAIAKVAGRAMLLRTDTRPEALAYANLDGIGDIATRGPLTPDHVIRTKRIPAVLTDDIEQSVIEYAQAYAEYFERNNDGSLTMLDPAPRWLVWPGRGMVACGPSLGYANAVRDIVAHTANAIRWAEALGGWKALDEKSLFDMEYWELEQAKLKKGGSTPEFQGKVALVTGAASGIGLACVRQLIAKGACVLGLDIRPDTARILAAEKAWGVVCDVQDASASAAALQALVLEYGGLDMLVLNAGVFPRSQNISDIEDAAWRASFALHVDADMGLLRATAPYLAQGIGASIVINASKNVLAPGKGAAAYSASKAALTQLGRVAALELAEQGIRVNIVHPDAVFDTQLWDEESIADRAKHYGLDVESYKRRNLLRTDIQSADVARMVVAMLGAAFAKTTGAQVAVDGGSDRIV